MGLDTQNLLFIPGQGPFLYLMPVHNSNALSNANVANDGKSRKERRKGDFACRDKRKNVTRCTKENHLPVQMLGRRKFSEEVSQAEMLCLREREKDSSKTNEEELTIRADVGKH